MAIDKQIPENQQTKLNQPEAEVFDKILGKEEPVDDETTTQPEDPVVHYDAPSEDGEIVVAGLFNKLIKPVNKNNKGKADEELSIDELTEKTRLEQKLEVEPPNDFEITESGSIKFREVLDEEVLEINDAIASLGVTKPDKDSSVALQKLLMSDDIDEIGLREAITKTYAKQVEELRKGKVPVKDLLDKANQLDLIDTYKIILKKKPPYDEAVAVRGIIEAQVLYGELKKLARRNLEQGLTPKETKAWFKLFRVFGTLYTRTAADISIAGRKMRTLQSLDTPKAEAAEDMLDVLQYTDDIDDEMSKKMMEQFLVLEPFQAGRLARDSFGKRLVDAWQELWMNSLLSSPYTHMKNIIGNTVFNTLRIAEYGIAAGFNKLTGNTDANSIQMNEVLEMVQSLKQGFRLGMGMGKRSFITGEQNVTKMDLRRPNAFGKRLLGDKYQDTFLGDGLEFLGTLNRLPGRFLVAEDEFAKGILYKMEISRVARQRYNSHLQNFPGDIEGAEEIYTKTMYAPDNEAIQSAKTEMETGTFQGELPEGILKNIQSTFNLPVMKIFVPFYKTITNIYLEGAKRNPILSVLMPRHRADLRGLNGPRKAQLARAKLASGSMMTVTFAFMAYGSSDGDQDVMITGMAPTNKAEREAFYRKGFLPYSLAYKQRDGSYKSISYAGFEPISAILATSADIGYMASRPDQYADDSASERIAELFAAAVASNIAYIQDQPFSTGFQDLGRLFQAGYGDPEGALERAAAILTEFAGRATVGVVMGGGPLQGFNNYLTRMQDPTIYDTLFTEEQRQEGKELVESNVLLKILLEKDNGDMHPALKKYYEMYNRSAMRSPFFNVNLLPRLNLWGEEMKGPEMNFYSPIRVMDEKYNKVDDELLKLGFGLTMPKARIEGIQLSQEQYYSYIKFINSSSDEMGGETMLQEMRNFIDSDSYYDMDIGLRKSEFDAILSYRKDAAKTLLKEKYPSLANMIERKKKIKQKMGR